MKIESLSQDLVVEEFGQELKTLDAKITQKNTPYIFSLLSNIYSRPIESIVREITSNCFDAHIKVNKPNEIVFIKLYIDSNGDSFIDFIDQGPGMSYEFIDDTYLSYGESDKRESDDYIGAFGLGSKSPFSKSEYFYVHTKENGLETHYTIYKTVKGPKADVIFQQEILDGSSGTTVRIPIDSNELRQWESAISSQLKYFTNVFVINFLNVINEYKIKQFNTFQFREDLFLQNTNSRLHLVVGNVVYPIDFIQIGEKPIYFNAAIKFNIGELDITPNREELQYTTRTIETLKNQFHKFKTELHSILLDKSNLQFDNFYNFNICAESLEKNESIVNKNLLNGEIFIQNRNVDLDFKSINYKVLIDGSYYSLNHHKLNHQKYCTLTYKKQYNHQTYSDRLSLVKDVNFRFKIGKYCVTDKSRLKLNERNFLNNDRSCIGVVKFNKQGFINNLYKSLIKDLDLHLLSTKRLSFYKALIIKVENELLKNSLFNLEDLDIPKDYGIIKQSRISIKKATNSILVQSCILNNHKFDFHRSELFDKDFKDKIYVYTSNDNIENLYIIAKICKFLDIKCTIIKVAKSYFSKLETKSGCFFIEDILKEKFNHVFFKDSNHLIKINTLIKSNIQAEYFDSISNLLDGIKTFHGTSNYKTKSKTIKDFISLLIKTKKYNFNCYCSTSYYEVIKFFLNEKEFDKLVNKLKESYNPKKENKIILAFLTDFYLEINELVNSSIYGLNDHEELIISQSLKMKKYKLKQYLNKI